MKKILAMVLLYTSLSSAVYVGVMGYPVLCPDRMQREVYLDAEDHNNISGIVDGEQKVPYGVSFALGRVGFVYCRMSSEHLQPVPYDYAVLRMDNECPAGGYKFRRHHDTEDHNNNNATNSDFWPSVIGKDADLEYCFMPATPGATADFPVKLFGRFGVFGTYRHGTVHYTQILVDDEDTKNANSWHWYGQDNNTNLINRIKAIVSDKGKDTYYSFSWVDPFWDKIGIVDAPTFAENVIDNAVPEVKGFGRSAVSFELKSAGIAVVTISNLNGAEVARITTNFLPSGLHRVEWHSGAVPNGRYVVTIEHNGKVSGKNVILK